MIVSNSCRNIFRCANLADMLLHIIFWTHCLWYCIRVCGAYLVSTLIVNQASEYIAGNIQMAIYSYSPCKKYFKTYFTIITISCPALNHSHKCTTKSRPICSNEHRLLGSTIAKRRWSITSRKGKGIWNTLIYIHIKHCDFNLTPLT